VKQMPILIAFILAVVLTLQWIGWRPTTSTHSASPSGTPETASNALPATEDLLARIETPDPLDNYVSIIERPLFRPDRKPEPPSDDPSTESSFEDSVELATFDLTAVLITRDLLSAWVQDPAQPKLRRLRLGDDLQGWLVTGIQEDRVLFERQGRQNALLLRDYSQASPAAPPPSAPKGSRRPPPRLPVRAEPPEPPNP